MAKTSLIIKTERLQKASKFKSRVHSRCKLCGRPRGFLRKFQLCRLCSGEPPPKAEVPGVIKASW